MLFRESTIRGVFLIDPEPRADERGFLPNPRKTRLDRGFHRVCRGGGMGAAGLFEVA